MKFALYFANRGFFPGELAAAAYADMTAAVEQAGHQWITMDLGITKYGAVETVSDGEKYAAFLKEHAGEFDGVILCLPNFGDENGAVAALKDAGVPILVQAYPDEIGKMSFELRRDAFCGKFSIMDMFTQYNIPFTVYKPHVCAPRSKEFISQIDSFARVCAVVKGMKRFSVGAIGARVTAFKTVRYDELTLQKHGITVDTFDLSDLFHRVATMKNDGRVEERFSALKDYADFSSVPVEKFELIAKTSLAIEDMCKEFRLDTLALRCWNEFPQVLGISVCVVVGFLNHIGIPCACESDVCNAVAMRALTLATGNVSTCLDWNNNYGSEKDKCILFHCGPVARDLMTDKGVVTDHKMLAKSWGAGCAFGTHEGRIKSGPFTYLSAKTEGGVLSLYGGEGKFTEDAIEDSFFGCGGVAQIDNLEDVLLYVGKNGYRHHVSAAFGSTAAVLEEALGNYCGMDIHLLKKVL